MMDLARGMMSCLPRWAYAPEATTMGVVAAISNYAIMLQGCSLILGTIAIQILTDRQIELRLRNLTACLGMVIWREI